MSRHIENNEIVFIMPNMSGGGAERVVATLANDFTKRGICVQIALTKSGENVYKMSPDVEVITNDVKLSVTPIHQTIHQIRFIRQMMKRHGNATFVSFLPLQNIYMLLAAMGMNNRTVVSVRGYPPKIDAVTLRGIKPLIMLQNHLYKRVADGVVFQTDEQSRHFDSAVRAKGVVILNPLRDDIPLACLPRKRRKAITTVGRLVPQKNHQMTLQAFSLVHKKHPDYRLEIYGKGPLENNLLKLAKQLGIQDAVDFKGFISDAAESVATSTAFVMSSEYEGVSNALIEAISMGVPTVCTRCKGGGAEEVVSDGVNGILVDIGDAEAMGASLVRLIEDNSFSKVIASNALQSRQRFSSDSICEQWMRFLI